MVLKVDVNQARPVVGVTDANVNRPFIKLARCCDRSSQAQSIGQGRLQRTAAQVPAPLRQQLLVPELVHIRQVDGLRIGQRGRASTNTYDLQYNRGPSDYDVRHTFSSSWVYELPLAKDKIYGGWQLSGILYLRGGLPLTITQTQGVQSTGTGNRPNRICDGNGRNPTIDKWFDTSCFVRTPDITGTYGDAGRGIIRGPGSFNIDASLIKNTKIRRCLDRVPARGVQRAQPSAVRQPEHDVRQRGRGHNLRNAVEPVLLAVRHD